MFFCAHPPHTRRRDHLLVMISARKRKRECKELPRISVAELVYEGKHPALFDVTLQTKDKETVQTHKLILAEMSPVLSTALCAEPTKHLIQMDFTKQVVSAALCLVTCSAKDPIALDDESSVKAQDETIIQFWSDLWEFAHFYEIKRLEHICVKMLIACPCASFENAKKLYEMAMKYQSKDLEQRATEKLLCYPIELKDFVASLIGGNTAFLPLLARFHFEWELDLLGLLALSLLEVMVFSDLNILTSMHVFTVGNGFETSFSPSQRIPKSLDCFPNIYGTKAKAKS